MKSLLFAAAFGWSAVLCAAPAPPARIDFIGIDGTSLAISQVFGNTEAGQAGWMGEKRDQRLVLNIKASRNWETQKFVFVPKKDGFVRIVIMPDKKAQFAFDGFEIEGAVSKLRNPGFEESDSKIAGWKSKPGGAEIRSDGAFEGKNYVFISKRSNNVGQGVKVRRGVPVTVKFAVKEIPDR